MSVSLVIDSPPASDTISSAGMHLGYRPDIDGLRAIAALAVLGAHAGWLPGGGAGVDVFFVISGFLISGIILRDVKRGSFSLLDFYARRVKRIFPALLALLLAVWGMGWLILTPQQYSALGADIAAGAGFAENLWFYATITQRTQTPDFLITHLWTLGIEEQFYLLWPIFLCASERFRRGQGIPIVAVTALSLACYAWTIPKNGAAWLLPWNRLWELSMGGALAYLQLGKSLELQRAPTTNAVQLSSFLSFPRLPAGQALASLGAACLALSLFGLPTTAWPASHALTPAIGSFLLIAAGPQSWFNRYVLSTRALVLIGLFSYPLYLWHVSLFVLLPIFEGKMPMAEYQQVALWMKIAASIASVVLSYLTYKYIELPIRSSAHTKRISITLCVAMALCGSVAFLVSR